MSQYTNVLLIDDDKATLIAYRRLLDDTFGDSVMLHHCQHKSGLEDIIDTNGPFDIIILDQRLNNGTRGIQLIPMLKRISPSSQILVNSAYGNEELAAKAIDAGANGYILGQKSDDDEFTRSIKNAINKQKKLDSIKNDIIVQSTVNDLKVTEKTASTKAKMQSVIRQSPTSLY